MNRPDVSLAVFARDEGLFLHACLESVRRAVARAERDGRQADLVLVLHQPSRLTSDWADSFVLPPWRILRLEDPRRETARQAAAAQMTGRFASFIDASDLWSKNWISAALNAAERNAPAVWRPEVVLRCSEGYYTDRGYLTRLQPELPCGAAGLTLLHENPFASSFLASRALLAAVPFPASDEARGWSDCDWWWSCNAQGQGFPQRIVPNTALYRRLRPGAAPEERGRPGPTSLGGAFRAMGRAAP